MTPRLKPAEYETTYHCMIRTAQCEHWLKEHGIKDIIEEILAAFSQIYSVEIHSSCLMDDHMHLVLTVKKFEMDEAEVKRRFELLQAQNKRSKKWYSHRLDRAYERFTDLSWFMWEINKRIAVRFNRIRGRKGHLWGAPYKSKLIEDDQYLIQAMSYVDQNPVRAGMVEKPEDFPYCTSAKIKKALEEGRVPELPAAGFLANYTGEGRARAWLLAQNKLAAELKAQKEAKKRETTMILENEIKGFDLAAMRKEMNSGAPSDWSCRVYGSQTFQEKIASGDFG